MDAVLLSHPDIAQAVAFGVPDEKYGEEVRNHCAEAKLTLCACEFLFHGPT